MAYFRFNNIKFMKKKIFIYIFIIASQWAFAQKNYVIEYKIFNNTNFPNIVDSKLLIDVEKNITLFHPDYSTKQKWSEQPKKVEDDSFFFEKSEEGNNFIELNHNLRTVKSIEYLDRNKPILITDIFPDFSWEVTENTETISGYKAKEARCTYRGREWIVWFTEDIALPYGPWKLHGLPGLILKANDKTEKYAFILSSITSQDDNNIVEKFETIKEKKFKEMSLKEFISLNKEYKENFLKELSSDRNIKIQTQDVPKSGYELKYEWEEKNK